MAAALRGDFLLQLLHVGDNAHRLLSLQDRDPASPAHGCFHYAYWRDKTSIFPDARFQEAAPALALLSLEMFDELRDARAWPDKQTLLDAFRSGVGNLGQQQYPEGCYDEWYKGERGFAATAFTTHAFGFAALVLGDRLSPADRASLVAILSRAAHWLAARDDVVKINHEVVAAAALAVMWKLTGEARWLTAARHKLAVSLAHRDAEGWFHELGGADLGYASLVLDYLMIYHKLTGDDCAEEAAIRLLMFLAPHLGQDMTVSAEAGTCRNSYVGQIGFLLLATRSETARSVCAALARMSESTARIGAYLSDDLRLVRWAVLPILAAMMAEGEGGPGTSDVPVADWSPQGWTIHAHAGLAAFHREGVHLHASVAGGGALRIFHDGRPAIEHLPPEVRVGNVLSTAAIYDNRRTIDQTDTGIAFTLDLREARYFFPGFTQRLILHFGSTTPRTSRWMRALVDRVRLKKQSAVNQSASSAAAGGGRYTLHRSIAIDGKVVRVIDILRDAKGSLRGSMVALRLAGKGRALRSVMPHFADAFEVTFGATFDLPRDAATFEVQARSGDETTVASSSQTTSAAAEP